MGRGSSKLVAIVAATALAAGCAAPPLGIKAGEEVAFIAEPPLYGRLEVEMSNVSIGRGAGAGMAGGALVGVAAALACGPFAGLCLAPALLVGSVGGAGIGAGVGGISGNPGETGERVLQRVKSSLTPGDFHRDLMAAIVERGKGHWVSVPQSHFTKVVRVRVDEISIRSMQNGRAALAVRIFVTVLTPNREKEEKELLYVGPEGDPRLWIENVDDFVGSSVRLAQANLAQGVFAHLAQ